MFVFQILLPFFLMGHRQYKETCLVEILNTPSSRNVITAHKASSHNVTDADTSDKRNIANVEPISQADWSCSGIVIEQSRGLVLTHASILASYLLDKRKSFKNLCRREVLEGHRLPGLTVRVTLEQAGAETNNKPLPQLQSIQTQLLSSPSVTSHTKVGSYSSQDQTDKYICHKGSIRLVWKAKGFAEALTDLFPSYDGWRFVDSADSQQDSTQRTKQEEMEAYSTLISYFVVIQLDGWGTTRQAVSRSSLPSRGQGAVVIATPFGNLSPSVFFNSYSKGVISNVSGQHSEVILTDARCLPGTEGGAVYTDNTQGCTKSSDLGANTR